METIGKYQIQRVVGHGGMGTVYEALDPLINRKVAVKTMMPGLAEAPELRLRFLREAQAAGGLRHRNIVTVYEAGEDRGQPYIAMEFIEGNDLEKIIQRREPLSIEWKIDVLRQVCEGLGYAHRNAIVHRDVKPANIRVTPDGEVKIMDFGIALLQSSTMTKDGLVLGTVQYIAPEQLSGQKVDHRVDIFSVGAIAYELLAYRKPFEGESISSVMFRITHESPDPHALPRTPYSPGLEAIVMKALARNVEERYQTLDEMHEELERIVRDAAEPRPADSSAGNDREKQDVRAELDLARQAGQLQKALGLSRRLLAIDANDQAAAAVAREIEEAIEEREIEQLSAMALAYAADGDLDLAQRIADRITRLAPRSARGDSLRSYLKEESIHRATEALVATGQEHLAMGNFDEACAAVDEALSLLPAHTLARDLRDRIGALAPMVAAAPQETEPAPGPIERSQAPAAVSDSISEGSAVRALTPLPEGTPEDPEAARLLEEARRTLRERAPQKALPLLEKAVQLDPEHPGIQRLVRDTRVESRRSEAEALTTAALDHFVRNDYVKARKAVEKALALEPQNKKARELVKILGALA